MKTNRRSFIRNSALASLVIGSFPFIVNAGFSPNEKITIGLIGCKGMGFINLKAFLKLPHVECVALCDVDRNVLEKRGAEVEKIQHKKPILYDDFRKLLENRDVDAVINATPDHWHTLVGVYSMESGKALYTEKPLANSIQECEIMVAAQKKYKSVVQVGQWHRSDPNWKAAMDYLRGKNLGKISSVRAWSYTGEKSAIPVLPDSDVPFGVNYNLWLGPAPKRAFNQNRFHQNFRWFWDYSGGLMVNSGVNLLDYALYGMQPDVPKSVMATGGKFAFSHTVMETPDTLMAVYDFGNFKVLWDHAFGFYGSNFNRRHGVAFAGEWGTLVVGPDGWEVIPETSSKNATNKGFRRMPFQNRISSGLDLHVANFIDCIKTGNKPNCDIETGAKSAKISHLGNISYRLGRKVFWDDEKKEFNNDEEANRLACANYRLPWKLPEV